MRLLLNVIEGLPRTSAYAQAIADDEELAEHVVRESEQDRSPVQPRSAWRRENRDYSAEVEMLSAVFDRLGELCAITARTRKQPQTAPRPIRAIQRVRERRAREKHDSLKSRLLPKK